MPSWIPIGTMARMKTMTFLRTRSIRRREKLALAQNLSTKETAVPHTTTQEQALSRQISAHCIDVFISEL